MALLEISEPFILVDLPRVEPLYRGPSLCSHLLVSDPSDIEGSPNAGMLLASKVLRLDLGFLISGQILTILPTGGQLLLHDVVVYLDLLTLGLLTGSMGPELLWV